MTTVELMLGSTFTTMVLLGTVGLLRISNIMWTRSEAEENARRSIALVSDRLLPTLRGALRVDTANSTSSRITLVMPKVNTTTGYLAQPLQAGDTIAFYLADSTGSQASTGTILWRSVNGSPDAAWSLRPGGKVDLGTAGLSFAYVPTSDPEQVQVRITALQSGENGPVTRTSETTILLRNSQY